MTTKEAHPRGLYVLFFAEAWERMSYYGMRALLVLYLMKHLGWQKNDANQLMGMYVGLVYLTPVIGGQLADRYLGRRKAVLIGGVVMALGHLAMAFEGLLFTALGLLIIGNGFFKPNISTMVGGLYREGDARRDQGFTIFYMGINLGAFFAPLVCGTLGESKQFGWHYGFSAAGVGMVVGLVVFMLGQRLLGTVGFPPSVKATPETRLGTRDWVDVGIHVVASVVLVLASIQLWKFVGPVWRTFPTLAKVAIALTIIAGIIVGPSLFAKKTETGGVAAPPLTSVEWHRIIVIAVLCFFVIFFWAGFEQASTTFTVFAETQTNRIATGIAYQFPTEVAEALSLKGDAARIVLGWEFPTSWFQFVNPLLIVLMAPLFGMLWSRWDRSKFALSTPAKMGLGLVVLGLGFVIMSIAQNLANSTGLRINPLWLASVYLVHTAAELCLSPIGLSMVTKLSPARIVSLMMGLWFVSSSIAGYLAGALESIVEVWHIPLYPFLIGSSVGSGVVLCLLAPLLKKLMHGAEDIKDLPVAPANEPEVPKSPAVADAEA